MKTFKKDTFKQMRIREEGVVERGKSEIGNRKVLPRLLAATLYPEIYGKDFIDKVAEESGLEFNGRIYN